MEIKELNDLINEGYDFLKQRENAAACTKWGQAWSLCKNIAQQHDIMSVDQFDQTIELDQYVSDWIQDYEMALTNAAIDDPQYCLLRLNFIVDFLGGLGKHCDELLEHNMRRSMAESIFILGERDRAEGLFREWLNAEPAWGWGWINWADCWYLFADKSLMNYSRSEEILLEGLTRAVDEEKEFFYERLADLYNDMNEAEKAADAKAMLKKCQEQRRSRRLFGGAKPLSPLPRGHSEPIRVEKVGRNQPCPCGSGKKYKKCCGRDVG